MLSAEELDEYIAQIPPVPAILKACKSVLNEGDLVKAADLASKDKALMAYFKNIVNKPIFGFRDELKDARQIFGALGLNRTRQLFQSYYTLLLAPKQWSIFKLNNAKFQELQASFILRWDKILQSKNAVSNEHEAIITLIPAAIAVCESLFEKHRETIEIIKKTKAITYEAMLQKMSGYTFFDIVKIIATKWEFPEETVELFNDIKNSKNEIIIYLLLLINYEMSRPICMESGINDLFELSLDFPPEIIGEFFTMMSEVD